MRSTGYHELDHPADVALHVRGSDLSSRFLNASRGLLHLLRCGREPSSPDRPPIEIALGADDLETLMVDWLGELLYLVERHGCCPTVEHVEVSVPPRLDAIVHLCPECSPRRELKAATYAGLTITRGEAGFEAEIVLDA